MVKLAMLASWRDTEGTEGWLHSFFTSALDRSEKLTHAPGASHPRQNSGLHWTGSLVGPTAGLEVSEKGNKSLAFCGKINFSPIRKGVAVTRLTGVARYEAIGSDNNTQQTFTAESVNNHVHGPKRYLRWATSYCWPQQPALTPRGPCCTHDLTARTVVAKMQGSVKSGVQKEGTIQPGCANQKQLHARHVN